MKFTSYITIFCLLICSVGYSQSASASSDLFESEAVLPIQLKGNIRELLQDRGNDPQYHPISLSYQSGDGTPVSFPMRARVRGNFRRLKQNCVYPPLLLNFSNKATPSNSTFSNQDKLKLVTPCQGDEFVVQEYLVYKLYNLISPNSFKARLVHVTLDDSVTKKKSDPMYGIILEDEDQMAKRNGAKGVEPKLVRPESTQRAEFLKMAVFEYLIGNTDWSVQYLQNVKLIVTDSLSLPIPVPYDFDHAGIVEAPYALPAPELRLNSTRQRLYRGYCMPDLSPLAEVLTLFNQLKTDFYDVYRNSTLIDERYRKSTLKFLDDFYETINDEKKMKTVFNYPCRKDGTGNVIIKGLKNN